MPLHSSGGAIRYPADSVLPRHFIQADRLTPATGCRDLRTLRMLVPNRLTVSVIVLSGKYSGINAFTCTSITDMYTPYPPDSARKAAPVLLSAITAILLLFASPIQAQLDKDVDPALAVTFQALIDDMQTKGTGVVGLAAAVAMPDGGRWEGAAGSSTADLALEPGMLQGIGSITKTYVATLVLKLAEEGRLSLDDSLHRWLPAYVNVDSTVTIRQLLGHTSGIYNYTDNAAMDDSLLLDLYRIWTPEEIVSSFVKARNFAPGNGWRYCNTGYVLLGMIIEKVTGRTVESEIREQLLTPNALAHTFFPEEETLQGDVADPWGDVTGDGVSDNISNIPREGIHSTAWAAGAMFSTPKDLVTWGRALYGGNVLTPASLEQMLTFRNLSLGIGTGYGLGAMRFKIAGRTIYGHGGDILGYSSMLLYSPQDRVTVALIVNEAADALDAAVLLMTTAINNAVAGVRDEHGANHGLSGVVARRDAAGRGIIIDYMLDKPGAVHATIHDLLGNEVASIATDDLAAGTHTLRLQADDLPRSIYFYRLTNGVHTVTGRIML